MSKYTTELRFICEALADKTESVGYDKIDEVVDAALPKLFDFDFPLFDEAYRTVLEKKIVLHYYTREICAETVGLWKLFLRRRLNEIMPYYNQLYRTELIEFNPLYDIDLTRQRNTTGSEAGEGSNTATGSEQHTNTRNTTGETDRTTGTTGSETTNIDGSVSDTGSSLTNSNEDHVQAYSDTPNNKLSNVTDLTYLTNLTHNTADDEISTQTSNREVTDTTEEKTNEYTQTVDEDYSRVESENKSSSQNNTGSYTTNLDTTEEYIETVRGSSGGMTYSKRIAEFRKNILNIDMDVIRELDDLFFGLW